MAPVLGESGQAAKARACLPVGPIDGADVDGRAAMGERRPNQRLEEKMTRTTTVIVVATGAAMLALAAPSAGFAQSTSGAPKKKAVCDGVLGASRPEPARSAHAHPGHAGLSGDISLPYVFDDLSGALQIRVSRSRLCAPMHLMARDGKPRGRHRHHAPDAVLVAARRLSQSAARCAAPDRMPIRSAFAATTTFPAD